MPQWLHYSVYTIFVITLLLTVYYSIRSRRSSSPRLRGLHAAKMNISMGIMLVSIAMIQLLLFSGSTTRVVIGAVFLLLGLFNFFAGMRNHTFYKHRVSPDQ
jgi:hypothetical protein